MNYDELIYNLLNQYLPSIDSSLSTLNSMLPDISDIRKYILFLLIFFISSKLVRWSYRV